MNRKKYKNILIISTCIILILLSIATEGLIEETLHIEHCEAVCCLVCSFIDIIKCFKQNLVLMKINILILFQTIFLIYLTYKKVIEKEKITLVKLKIIQLN